MAKWPWRWVVGLVHAIACMASMPFGPPLALCLCLGRTLKCTHSWGDITPSWCAYVGVAEEGQGG